MSIYTNIFYAIGFAFLLVLPVYVLSDMMTSTSNKVYAQNFFINGTKGDKGDRGLQGPPETTKNITIRHVDSLPIKIIGIVNITAQCNSDERISGGGFSIIGGIGFILASEPQNNSWVARAANPIDTSGSNMGNLTAHATCIKLVSSVVTK